MEKDDTRSRRRILKVYTIVEKPGDSKGIWLEIGVASENRDGSFSAKLDALPVNGAIHLRHWEPRRNDNYRRGGNNRSSNER